MNIIGDVAGRYEELMLLLDKMPKGEEIILLGDLNDRGPDTPKVIQWAIDNKIRCLKSNHGQMMIDAYAMGIPFENWLYNGGYQTLKSYGEILDTNNIPHSHIKYLNNCEWYIETDDVILTHAPINPVHGYKDKELENEFFWNRQSPKRENKFQIHGHNTYFTEYSDKEGLYAMCIDNSGNKQLMGINWPSRQIYVQGYLD